MLVTLSRPMTFSPCPCGKPKQCCIYIAAYLVVYSVLKILLFSWQLGVVRSIEDGLLATPPSPDEAESLSFYVSLYAIEVVALVAAVLLFISSLLLLTVGVRTNRRRFIWLWIPCAVLDNLSSLAYCAAWWSFGVTGYWLPITIILFLLLLFNAYCAASVMLMWEKLWRERNFVLSSPAFKNKQPVRARKFSSSSQVAPYEATPTRKMSA